MLYALIRSIPLLLLSATTLASFSCWTQLAVGWLWQGDKDLFVALEQGGADCGMACALSAVTLLGITIGGLPVAVRMCSLVSAAVFTIVFVASKCHQMYDLAERGFSTDGPSLMSMIMSANASSSVECTLMMAERYHGWVHAGVASGWLRNILRGPGDALYLIAAVRHMSHTWTHVLHTLHESATLLRKFKEGFGIPQASALFLK
jgi:hypothetical protein